MLGLSRRGKFYDLNNMKTLPIFFIGVAIALAIVLGVTYFLNSGAKFNTAVIFVAGFVIGMLTLYIKMRLIFG